MLKQFQMGCKKRTKSSRSLSVCLSPNHWNTFAMPLPCCSFLAMLGLEKACSFTTVPSSEKKNYLTYAILCTKLLNTARTSLGRLLKNAENKVILTFGWRMPCIAVALHILWSMGIDGHHSYSFIPVSSDLFGHVCIVSGILCGIDLAFGDLSFRPLAWLSNHHIIQVCCTSRIWEEFGVISPFQPATNHHSNAGTGTDNGSSKKQDPKQRVFPCMSPPTYRHHRTTAAVKVLLGGKNGQCTMLCCHTQFQGGGFHIATRKQSIVPISCGSLLVDVDCKSCLDFWLQTIWPIVWQQRVISGDCKFLLATGSVPVAVGHTPSVFPTIKCCKVHLSWRMKWSLTFPKNADAEFCSWCSINLTKAEPP